MAPPDDLARNLHADKTAFRRIVLPLDGSPVAERALPFAEALAKLMGAPLHLVRVTDPLHPGSPLANLLAVDSLALEVWLEGERVAAREYLEHLQEDLQIDQLSVTVERLEGPTVDGLLATTQPGDLLVMATRGRGGAARWFLGSTAEAVIRRATVPVFLVRADGAHPAQSTYHRIVVPLDGSSLAEEALPIAQELATRLGIPVHLITVIDVSGTASFDIAVAGITAERLEDNLTQLLTKAERNIARACEQLGDAGVEITTDVLHGAPGQVIPNATQPGDLIVMTTHGRSGPARWLLGSVAEAVVRRSTVPVLLMRVEEERPIS
ncbi:MAG: universal stress protein [Chloroflexota bacterium]|nr:universal stress protein [Chloroflexota bacterium]